MTFNAMLFMEPSQDFIKAGSIEIWEYINPDHDAHPVHVHLVNFQVLNRKSIDAADYEADYEKSLDVAANRRTGRCWRTTSPAHQFRRARTKRGPTRTRSSPIRRR
ncbi:multicopper oxidase domain-containing protein [Streptomyces sp. NPDC048611]|uniref:multicopper oxidase domain-containing protein n=1 Tax=Streptomyces sp. NPDC048611 TaxID=3155635 RepID=UPI003426F136